MKTEVQPFTIGAACRPDFLFTVSRTTDLRAHRATRRHGLTLIGC